MFKKKHKSSKVDPFVYLRGNAFIEAIDSGNYTFIVEFSNILPYMTPARVERFWRQIARPSGIPDEIFRNQCWVWLGSRAAVTPKNPLGYPVFAFKDMDRNIDYSIPAYRVGWALVHGREVPGALKHDGAQPSDFCCNPYHYYPRGIRIPLSHLQAAQNKAQTP